ncbi:MAG: AbrB family transcriptional regulator, partial [Xanthobacteraceae bacterium]
LLIGAAGGFAFKLVHAPLPWTLGSLTAAALVALCGGRWLVPSALRDIARPVVGLLAGSAFTAEVMRSLLAWWPLVPATLLFSVATSAAGYLYFARFCRFDRPTAFFASFPAGLSELSLLGASLGGNIRSLALVHATRVVTVVFLIPVLLSLFADLHAAAPSPNAVPAAAPARDWVVLGLCGLFAYLVRRPTRSFGGAMIIALILSAITHGAGWTVAQPPAWLVAGVQVVIGSIVGGRIAGANRAELGRIVLLSWIWALALIAFAALVALAAQFVFGRPFSTLLLAFAPGGMVEITLLAYAAGLEVAFVVTAQICRTIVALLIAPHLFRLIVPPDAPGGDAPNRRESSDDF